MPTSFTVNKGDLEYILKQIRIAEATSIGYTAAPISTLQAIMNAYGATAATASQLPAGLRTVDGTDNNLLPGQSDFGAADTLFPRLTDPVYRNEGDETAFNGVTNTNYGVGGSVVDSDPRIISNLIVDMSVNNPAAIAAYLGNPLSLAQFEADHPGKTPVAPGDLNDPLTELEVTNTDLQTIPNQSPDIGLSPGFNAWMTFFGQFFDHGLDLVTKGGNGSVYVPLQADDPLIAGADHLLGTADDLPAQMRFMTLGRATPTYVPGDANGDGVIAAGEVIAQHENTTTSFVDQNQTYTSHPSHQVFLREYALLNGKAVSTGKMLDGSPATGSKDGAIGNWADVKDQARTVLGLTLEDIDVLNVPLLATDQYGKFIPGPNGFAQLVMPPDGTHTGNWLLEGTAGGLAIPATALRTNHAFLNDLAHNAVPGTVYDTDGDPMTAGTSVVAPDADTDVGNAIPTDFMGRKMAYDDELLDLHMITGDGRGNENIALTTVHSIFHSEHNRLVDVNKATILASGDLAFINEWLLVDVAAVPADASGLVWDGERLFQAARFATEMQYQHLVFEEFARRIQPMVDPFIFNNSPNIDPAIVAEFAHTVYRFGHSMLTGTVDRLTNDLTTVNGDTDQKTLLAVFLNPQAYIGSGATLDEINANIVRGLSRDVGNAMDEFIVTDVRSNLLGLPLDLAVLNIARGRETGIPSLNETRAQLYNDTGLADLKPYASWVDFAENIKNAASVVNFIAAYGTHATITSETTLAGKRAAAEAIVFQGADTPADRDDFINGTGIYASNLGGLNDIDLWIGGLAEKINEFGGMLGSTFNYVFEAQMESLQFGDRLYYLTRTQGLNFLNQLEPNTFSDLVMRNTALGDKYSTHLNGALFVTPDHILELDPGIAQEDYDADAGIDPLWAAGEPHSMFTNKVTRILGTDTSNANGNVAGDGHYEGGTLKFLGGEHVVLGGTEGNDTLLSDRGIDTIWGDGGDDYINAGMESDDVFGGMGDDIIEDPFGDDVLRGNQGNDVITSARGADLMFGDDGTDYIVLGQDAGEIFGGTGGDFMLGGDGKDFLLGNEGDDWIEGGAGFDTIAGDNSELFFNSPITGHDVLFGQGDETDYDAESGDDIMTSAPSVFRYEGMFGFDWGIGKMDVAGVNFDLQIPIFTTIPNDVLRDRFDQVEALSGWTWDDHLDGDDRGHKGGGSSAPDSIPVVLFADHLLTQEGINRIDGFNTWFASARQTLYGAATPIPGTTALPTTTYRDGNILMGGDGNDFLRGRGGYDLLDGDAWLNVRIKIVIPSGPNAGTYSAESMSTDTTVAGEHAGKVYKVYTAAEQLADPTHIAGSPNFASVAFGGRSLTSLMLDKTLNPGELSIVREILYDTTPGDDDDTAIFQGTYKEYDIEGRVTTGVNGTGAVITAAADLNGDGFISVRDRDTGAVGATIIDPAGNPLTLSSRGALTDDVDLLKNVELLRFADQTIRIAGTNTIATGVVTISDLQNKAVNPADVSTTYDLDGDPATPALVTPYVGQVLTASVASVVDADGYPGSPGAPTGVTFLWQTTEIGSNAGWSTITEGNSYTVRSVDPGHVLRAVAVFQDNRGTTEAIMSAATDGATAPFRVDENSVPNTVVASSIPFSPDYDPDQTPGGPTDGDIVVLTHVLADSAGGRFKLVTVGGVQQIQVANGTLLDYETDNEHQIVIDSYIDAASAAALDPTGRIASRQFTVLLNNIEPEFVAVAPTDIQWNGVTPGDGVPLTGNIFNGLPASPLGIDVVIANLSTVDADTTTGFVYSLAAGSSSGFTVSPTGVVTAVDAMAPNSTYTLNISSADTTGGIRTETFTLRTGTNSALGGANGIDNLTASAFDSVIYASAANDTLNGGVGNDSLFGQAGSDVMTGGAGSDIVAGGGGTDTAVFAGSARDFNFGLGTGTLAVADMTGAEGIDTLSGMETLRFAGVNYALVNGGVAGTTLNGSTSATNPDIILGHGGIDTLNGNAGNDILVGGAGNDIVNGGAGNDTVLWRVGDGRDVINGDTAAANIAATTDTIHIAGDSSAEAFHIYSLAEATTAGITGLNANTEIVITRNGTNNASVIAELNNIEEIVIKGFGGGDTFTPHGSFVGTSLLTSTITIDGGSGNDTVDISALTSAHRIVFKSNGGNDTIIGTLRPDDVIELVAGTTAVDYTSTTDANGVTTMTNGTHSISFTSPDGLPEVTTPGPVDPGPVVPGDSAIVLPSVGTTGNDVLNGAATDDYLVGFTGDDVIVGNGGKDVLLGNEGKDFLASGAGEDTVFGGGGSDTIIAGDDADLVYGDEDDDRIFTDGGNDMVNGGAGNDTIVAGAGNDRIVAELNDGNDIYFGDEINGGTGIDTLDMSSILANVTIDLGTGLAGHGSAMSAQSGSDTLWGIENVITGAGADTVIASDAVNVIDGGAGHDKFVFKSVAGANGDTIVGFETGDKIDLGAIDANTGVAGNQAFTLLNSGQITGIGQLLVTHETRADGDYTVIEGNVANSATSEFKLSLKGTHALDVNDFSL